MCSYCGCRAIPTIADLTAEHEEIAYVAGELRRALLRGDAAQARSRIQALRDLLHPHNTVEEVGIYPAMARQAEYAEAVATLFDEHDEVDAVLAQALDPDADLAPGPILAALELLTRHVDKEENGLFPAAAVVFDPADWAAAEQARADLVPPALSP
ncbi:MAG TPA: hemerythrin domain-containing protein [Actinomycetes bacterium]|nr:hemerythrin domain-containing protein [Actinomycetes bacterium]